MDAIILISHGSLLCGHGDALMAHLGRMRDRCDAPIVEAGYLNYTEPTFADAVAAAVRRGATRIAVTPFFLLPGKFVTVDLPAAVQTARAAHPNVEFVAAAPIGYDDMLVEAVLETARSAEPVGRLRDLRRGAEACRFDPRCPLFATPGCPTRQVLP